MSRNDTPSTPSKRRNSLNEACCQKVRKLREFLLENELQLWAASGDDPIEDTSLWIACRSCAADTLLSRG
jgi:hypothetical protein